MALRTALEPAAAVQIYQRQSEPQFFAAGEVIFSAGDPGEYMYGILEGEIEEIVHGRVMEVIGPGDVFGVGALVHPDGTRVSTAVAKTDCKLAYIDQQRFLYVVQETPMFAIQVIRSYSDRLKKFKKHPLDNIVG